MPHSEYQMLICLIPRIWLHPGVNPYGTFIGKIYYGLLGWYILTLCNSASDKRVD